MIPIQKGHSIFFLGNTHHNRWCLLCIASLASILSGSVASEQAFYQEDRALQQKSFRLFGVDPVLFPIHPTLSPNLWEIYDPSESADTFIDSSRRFVSKGVEQINDSLDVFLTESFWGDQIDVDEDSGSSILLRLYSLYDFRNEDTNVGFGANLKLVLANTNERLKLILTSQEDDEQDSGLVEDNQLENDVSAAVRFLFNENNRFKTSFDQGVRWSGGPRAFAQLRARYQHKFTHWDTRFTKRVFWENTKGAGFDADWDFSRALSERLGVSNSWDWEYLMNDGFWTFGYSWRFTLVESASISMRWAAGISANDDLGWQISNSFVSYSWRKRIYKDFIFLEIRPGFNFPREEEFKHQPNVYVSLDYLTY